MKKAKNSRSKAGSRSSKSSTVFKNYTDAVRFLLELTNWEVVRVVRKNTPPFKLNRIKALLDGLGNPQNQIKFVHIAGTNGKGSTVAMLSSMLQSCGYTIGTFTSPHLTDIRERIQVNGNMISRAEFLSMANIIADEARSQGIEEELTFFEAMTAMAFQYFADQAIDLALIETGMGGRLDCTNVITPILSMITQIDLDHTSVLGSTLPEIAREKAGILKKEVPSLMFTQGAEVEDVIREGAEKVGSPLQVVNKDIEFSSRFCATPDLGPHTRVCLYSRTTRLEHLPVPLPGEHQASNCGLALAAIDILKSNGFDCPENQLTDGLASTVSPGRMTIAWQRPQTLLDGAHNPSSLKALMRCIGAHVPYDSMICIFGCCMDKDVDAMLEQINLGADKVIFTRATLNPRAACPEELQKRFSEISGKMSQVANNLEAALDLAGRAVTREDLICITGSFYLVGEALKFFQARERRELTSQVPSYA